ncbi:hypothetical protein GCM10010295_32000 [Streptomyces intermedius]
MRRLPGAGDGGLSQPNRRCLNLGCGGLPSLHHAPDRLEVRAALRVGDAELDRRFGDPVEVVEVRHVPMPGQGVKTVLVNGYRAVRDGQGCAGVHGAAQERVLAGAADP